MAFEPFASSSSVSFTESSSEGEGIWPRLFFFDPPVFERHCESKPQVMRHQNWTESVTGRSRLRIFVRLISTIMRGAFVVQLGPETKTSEGHFEGSVEEVDSGIELRFRSTGELLQFIGQRFDVAMASTIKARTQGPEQTPTEKDNSRKGRESP